MTKKEYDEAVSSSALTLVEFFASWCPHCQRMMPVVAEVKKELAGQAQVLQFDIDKYSELAGALNVDGIPTFIVYENGHEVTRQSGEMSASALLQMVQQYETAK